jgi:hypothetical protein
MVSKRSGAEKADPDLVPTPKRPIWIPVVEARLRGLLNPDPRSMVSVALGEPASVRIRSLQKEAVC